MTFVLPTEPEAPGDDRARPTRVALAGCGELGVAVARLLEAHPDRWTLVGALESAYAKPWCEEFPVVADPASLFAFAPEVLVVTSDADGAVEATEWALESGADVVTANRAQVAARGPILATMATATGARFAANATVGGAAPILERLRALAATEDVVEVAGFFDAPANLLLERIGRGERTADVLRTLRSEGVSDPDRSGHGTIQALTIVAREAFGTGDVRWMERSGLGEVPEFLVRAHAVAGRPVRLLGTVTRTDGAPVARVRCVPLDPEHRLAGLVPGRAAALIRFADGGFELVEGDAAGRWPVARALVADAEALRVERSGACAPLRSA